MSWYEEGETLSCRFRGVGVICTREEYKNGKCDSCGWNPLVEAERTKEIKDGKRT